MNIAARLFCALSLLLLCATEGWVRGPASGVSSPLNQLKTRFPGIKLHSSGSRVRAVYGAPMTRAGAPSEAAAAWLVDHGAVFGADPTSLHLVRTTEVSGGRFQCFSYEQRVLGLPVDPGYARILVRVGSGSEVVYAAARLLDTTRMEFPEVQVSAVSALDRVRKDDAYEHLSVWGDPELVVLSQVSDLVEEPVRVYRLTGRLDTVGAPRSFTFFVDAATGELVAVRDNVLHADVSGSVNGFATQGTVPDVPSNPPVSTPVPGVIVRIQGGATATTLEDGSFTIPHPGTDPVTVEVDLVGPFADVRTAQGTVLHEELMVSPPGPADLLFNGTPDEFGTAQVNVFLNVNKAHNFFTDRAPGFTSLDIPIECNVNIALSCGGTFESTTPSLGFFHEGGGCPNAGYSSVVIHEYAHFIVDRLGLVQGAFGEGYADSLAMLILDDPVIGRDFLGAGNHLREPLVDNIQYPCPGGGIHTCSQVLSGVWFRIKQAFEAQAGAAGVADAYQLFVDWSLLTLGGDGDDAAHPMTAIEVLTVDDDDGDLSNGTPHLLEICSAFSAHSIPCPSIPGLVFEYPDGLSDVVLPDRETTLRVNVLSGIAGDPVPGSGTMSISVDGGGFVETPLTELAPNQYELTLPVIDCLSRVSFFVSAEATSAAIVTDPPLGALNPHSLVATSISRPLFSDDFEADLGWTVVNVALTGGAWERGIPVGDGTRGDPTVDFDGSGQCYLTSNLAGNSDVDGGPTRLVSPVFDLAGTDGRVSYAYWLSNDDGDDLLVVQVSEDGVNWVNARSYVGGSGGWFEDSFLISDVVSPGSGIQVRFSTADVPNNSITEVAVDAVRIEIFECRPLVFSHGPLVRGESTEFVVTGAVPGSLVGVVASTQGSGSGPCFGQLGGLCLEILPGLTLLRRQSADLAGEVRFFVNIPPGVPLVSVYSQAANRAGAGGIDSTVSNVVVEVIRD